MVRVGNSEGDARTFPLELHLFGEVVNVTDVSVPPRETETTRFVHRIDEPGAYTAIVGDERATVRVEPGAETDRSAGAASERSGFDSTLVPLALAVFGLLAAAALGGVSVRRE